MKFYGLKSANRISVKIFMLIKRMLQSNQRNLLCEITKITGNRDCLIADFSLSGHQPIKIHMQNNE